MGATSAGGPKILMDSKEALLIFCDALDAAIVQLRRNLNEAVSKEAPKPQILPLPVTEQVASKFPEDLRQLLGFEEKEEWMVIRPKQFLGSDNFSQVATIVHALGGEYVSAAKLSHFRVPKTKETAK